MLTSKNYMDIKGNLKVIKGIISLIPEKIYTNQLSKADFTRGRF